MCCIVCHFFIPVEPETGPRCVHEDHRVIPVQDPLLQAERPGFFQEALQHTGSFLLHFPDIAFARHQLPVEDPCQDLPGAADTDEAQVHQCQRHRLQRRAVLVLLLQASGDLCPDGLPAVPAAVLGEMVPFLYDPDFIIRLILYGLRTGLFQLPPAFRAPVQRMVFMDVYLIVGESLHRLLYMPRLPSFFTPGPLPCVRDHFFFPRRRPAGRDPVRRPVMVLLCLQPADCFLQRLDLPVFFRNLFQQAFILLPELFHGFLQMAGIFFEFFILTAEPACFFAVLFLFLPQADVLFLKLPVRFRGLHPGVVVPFFPGHGPPDPVLAGMYHLCERVIGLIYSYL